MTPQPIGKGMIRATIRNSRTRDKLSRIPGVTVDGNNVYYPAGMAGLVDGVVRRHIRKRIKQGERNVVRRN
jgi:hypothetical protein